MSPTKLESLVYLQTPFFGFHEESEAGVEYNWYISADKIFSSQVKGFESFSRFIGIEFSVSRFSLFDGSKSSETAVSAHDVNVYIFPGTHCAMIQGRLAKGIVITKITIKKALFIMGKIETVQVMEFSNCVIQSYQQKGDIILFTFRYSSYSDSHTEFKDGTKGGTAATQVDLAKWEIEDS